MPYTPPKHLNFSYLSHLSLEYERMVIRELNSKTNLKSHNKQTVVKNITERIKLVTDNQHTFDLSPGCVY